MALGAVGAGYQNAYSYPAKTRTGTGGGGFEAVSAAFAANVTEEAKRTLGNGADADGYQESAGKALAAGMGSQAVAPAAEWEKEPGIDYQKFLQERIEELFLKLQNGETEPTYQIGAQSFTEKEWDKLLEGFDSAEEAIRELMREEHEKREAEQIKREQRDKALESSLLAGAFTSCVYPAGDSEREDIRYITCYTEEGIYCRREGQTQGYAWMIPLEGRESYDKVMELVGQFPSDWNLRFAANENFWKDFLKDEIDMDGFMEFMAGTKNGVPNYVVEVGASTYIDREKAQWAKYMYPGGPLYTVKEAAQIMWENFLKSENLTEEQYFAQQAAWKKRMGYPDYL